MVLMIQTKNISIFITTLQLPGAVDYDSHVSIHTSTANTGIILTRGFQKCMSYPTRSHGLLDHFKDIKSASKWKLIERYYPVQDRKYVSHTSVKMPCATNQFP